jgi:CheY-like chemotaxis protein
VHKLLYIEDNEDNLYMLTLWFDVLGGYEIVSAPDGAAGIAMAAADPPDLILMDLNLPQVDGWEATRRLKADPATRDIPIIALSAHAMAGDREKALATGCDDFDTKPIEFDRLLAKIEQALATQPHPNPPPCAGEGMGAAKFQATAANPCCRP